MQKQVGQTSVQLPQVRQRSATSSQRGCSRFVAEQVADVGGVELAAHPGSGALGLRRRLGAVGVGRGGRVEVGQNLLALLAPRLDREVLAALEQLGEDQVVAGIGRRAGPHRGAEARPAGLVAVDGDEEDVLAPGRVVAVGVAAAEQDTVLHRDRGQLARLDAEEGELARVHGLLIDLEPVPALRRAPEPHARREQILLPRGRPGGVAEARVVVAALEPVAASVLDVRPAGRQLVGRFELVVDDRAVANGRPDDGVLAAT